MRERRGQRKLPLSIINEPGWVVDGTAVHLGVRVLDTLGGGRCSIAAPYRALGTITTAAADQYNIDLCNLERDALAQYAVCNYSPARWVADVPWRFRFPESLPMHSSYEQMLLDVVHGGSTAWLPPSYLVHSQRQT